jgi:CRISPR/Cas system CSM-associated protein Csm4 (group 5 of RAMP superfamily)
MAYSLYRMEFTTGLHIGTEAGGPSLDNSRMTIPSDTLYSALCCECVKNGRINDLYQYFNENFLSISDALPYQGDEFFYLNPYYFLITRVGITSQQMLRLRKNLNLLNISPYLSLIST